MASLCLQPNAQDTLLKHPKALKIWIQIISLHFIWKEDLLGVMYLQQHRWPLITGLLYWKKNTAPPWLMHVALWGAKHRWMLLSFHANNGTTVFNMTLILRLLFEPQVGGIAREGWVLFTFEPIPVPILVAHLEFGAGTQQYLFSVLYSLWNKINVISVEKNKSLSISTLLYI